MTLAGWRIEIRIDGLDEHILCIQHEIYDTNVVVCSDAAE